MMTTTRTADLPTSVDPRVTRTRHDVLHAAIGVLLDEGWESVTHAHIARTAGYSKATVYAHWPSRTALIRDAFTLVGATPHHTPTGDFRTDLLTELLSFRTGMVELRLDRALAVLSDLTHSVPELVGVRDQLVADGERVVRELLGRFLGGVELDAATLMVCGAILHAALMHGQAPSDETIEASVDLLVRGLPPRVGSDAVAEPQSGISHPGS